LSGCCSDVVSVKYTIHHGQSKLPVLLNVANHDENDENNPDVYAAITLVHVGIGSTTKVLVDAVSQVFCAVMR
jgi:hypothetical protein